MGKQTDVLLLIEDRLQNKDVDVYDFIITLSILAFNLSVTLSGLMSKVRGSPAERSVKEAFPETISWLRESWPAINAFDDIMMSLIDRQRLYCSGIAQFADVKQKVLPTINSLLSSDLWLLAAAYFRLFNCYNNALGQIVKGEILMDHIGGNPCAIIIFYTIPTLVF